MSLLYGNPDLVELPSTRGFSAQSGPFITRIWKGTEEACNAALAETIGADHAEVSGDGAVYTLTARFANDPNDPQTEAPTREERLHWNRISKHIFESPDLGLSENDVDILRKATGENRKLNDDEILQISAKGIIAFALWQKGVESFVVDQPVVIITATASASFPWDIAFSGVDLIFSTSQMISDADLVSGWAARLPQDAAGTGFVYGWKKAPPEITTTGGNRSQLVQEYEYGLWWLGINVTA